MKIDINQAKLSVSDQYKVYLNNHEYLRVKSKLFGIRSRIVIFDLENNELIQIQQGWYLFKASYKLIIEDQEILLKTISFWKGHYRCVSNKDVYDIYNHKGLKVSIFKNDVQIAFFSKEAVSYFEGDNYQIIANDDSNPLLLVSFVIAWDNHKRKNKEGAALTIDIGKVGPEAIAFDFNWRPKLVS